MNDGPIAIEELERELLRLQCGLQMDARPASVDMHPEDYHALLVSMREVSLGMPVRPLAGGVAINIVHAQPRGEVTVTRHDGLKFMMRVRSEVIVLAQRLRVPLEQDDPTLFAYRAVLTGPRGEWRETFGSVAELRACLTGWRSLLSVLNYPARMLEWNIPEHWANPTGMRWIIAGKECKRQELDEHGCVIKEDK